MSSEQQVGNIVYQVEMNVARLIEAQRQVNDRLDRMEGGFNSTGRAAQNAERSFASLSRVAGALIAALSVQQVASYADAWTVLNNKVANSVKQGEQQADVMQRIFDISQATQSSLNGTATLYARLERGTRLLNTSSTDLAKLTTIINQGFAVSGATTQEAENAIVQLSQGLAAGALRGEEFNSVSEQGSRLMIALADSLGVSLGELRAMAAQGKITNEVIVNGLLSQGDAIGKEFAKTTVSISQGLLVAGNNVTKFFGENSTVKSFAAGFRDSVITMSENLELLSGALILVAGVMGSRYVAALTMATTAKIQDAIASAAASKASSVAAKDAMSEAAAKLRLAEVEKAATLQTLRLAEGRTATIRATQGAVASEVQLAEAHALSIRANIAQIESEKLLEAQRLKAQITDQGRIATATRMAQLQQASAALTARLATAEAATAQARATAIAAAEAQVSAARLAAADATGLATAANGRYIASQEAAVIASRAASASGAVLRGALGLIGGPAGAAMLAAAAIFYFWQKSEQAKREAIAFADGLDRLNDAMKSMSNTQLRGTIADANESVRAQVDAVKTLEGEVATLQARYKNISPEAERAAQSMGNLEGYLRTSAEVTDNLHKKSRDLANAREKLAKTEGTQAEASRLLTNNMLTSMGVHDGLIEKGTTLERVQGAVARAFGTTADEVSRANQAGQSYNPKSLNISPATEDGDKMILSLEEQNKLLKIKDERTRAVTKAEMEMSKVSKNRNQVMGAGQLAGENYDLQKAEEARKKAQQESLSQDKKSASATESVAQKLANMKQQSELTADSTREMSREQAILTAQQSLGAAATQKDLQLAAQYAAKKWDGAAAIRAQAAAQKLIPETAENVSYQQDVSDLKVALAQKKITQQEYDTTAERMAQDHQDKLAQIRAGQAVTPQQQSAGLVDPVQALANENARKLALIQQFEQNKTLTEQQALALRNSLNTEYEQQRVAAQWEIWRNQSTANEAAAASFDAFAGSASNALTGIISGSMSASQAMQSLGNTVLNSLINTFVQMGAEWVRSAVMGSSAQIAATTATTTASVAGIATTTAASTAAAGTTMTAWLPAALVASIGSFGAAAVVGGAALLAGFGLISALSGKRKNGGPVSAGGLYQVGEGGMPEIYQASNGRQYMIPGDNGSVISNKDLQGGSSTPNVSIQFIDQSTGRKSFDAQSSMDGNTLTVTGFISDMEEGGEMSQAITRNTTASRRANG
ncbi:tape measure protein [Pectobacterium versatile]|uniref:tape measure protein n=1 Tax=Pectobacterium versatile TaxID=2488639 RepID=UPI003AFA4E8D